MIESPADADLRRRREWRRFALVLAALYAFAAVLLLLAVGAMLGW